MTSNHDNNSNGFCNTWQLMIEAMMTTKVVDALKNIESTIRSPRRNGRNRLEMKNTEVERRGLRSAQSEPNGDGED